MALLLIVIYVVFISLGLPDSIFGVAWPVVHIEFGVPQSFAAIYGIIIAFCTGGVSFVSGRMIRKFGTGMVTLVSVILTAVGLLGISFAPNIVVMMLLSVIMGYGAGAIDTGLNSYVSLHYEAKHMNWLHCFWGVGVTASPIIMSFFLGGNGSAWRGGYRVIALIQFSIAALVLLTLKKWKASGSETGETQAAPDKSMVELLKMPGVWSSILALGFYCAAEFLLNTWGASFAVSVFGITPDVAAKWVSLFFCGIMIGRVVAGFATAKFSDNALIYGGIAIALLGGAVLLIPMGQLSLLGFLLIGMGFGPIFPSMIHSIPARFGAAYSADLTGFHMGGAYAIGFGLQLIFGFTATATTFLLTPIAVLLLCAGVYALNRLTLRTLKAQ